MVSVGLSSVGIVLDLVVLVLLIVGAEERWFATGTCTHTQKHCIVKVGRKGCAIFVVSIKIQF